MQQPAQPRPYHVRRAFRPQHGCDHIAPDRAPGFGQIDQQREALAQRQRAQPVVTTDLRESERPDAERSHGDAIFSGASGNAMALRERGVVPGTPCAPGTLGGRCDDSTGGNCTVTSGETYMAGRAAALIYGLASYLIFSLSFAYTPAFLGNFLVPKTIDVGPDSAPGSRDSDRRDFAWSVRDPAQRHGAPGLQALVDAHHPGFLRAQHLCADLEPAADPDLLAVAPDRRDGLARRGLAGGRCSRRSSGSAG